MRRINGFIIKAYNRVISLAVINMNAKVCRRIRSMLFHNICKECEANFGGSNKQRRFYLIRCPQENMGLFAVINYVVWHLKKAEQLNREPVIDWRYYPNKYFTEDETAGKVNPWEAFFVQPAEITLDEVYQSYDVHMSSGEWEADALGEIFSKERLEESARIYAKYIHLNDEMLRMYEQEKERIGFDRKRVLAVKVRGTDFVTSAPALHSKVGSYKDAIKEIECREKDWGAYDLIYLATEDFEVRNKFIEYYGNRLVYTESTCFEKKDIKNKWLGDMFDSGLCKIDKIEEMRSYLLTTYMLAEADSLIAPVVGGTVGAMRIKGGYKNVSIYSDNRYEQV